VSPWAQVVASLSHPDISIRKRALDLLYAMCDEDNAKVRRCRLTLSIHAETACLSA